MGDSASQTTRYRRRKKHPYRRFVFILSGAAVVIGLVFLMIYLRSSPASSGVTSVGDDAAVQFK
jgi:hypothetical protein